MRDVDGGVVMVTIHRWVSLGPQSCHHPPEVPKRRDPWPVAECGAPASVASCVSVQGVRTGQRGSPRV